MCKDENRICDNLAGDDRRPLDVDREQLGEGHSGFVIVRLSRELPVVESEDLRSLAGKLKLSALGELLDLFGGLPTRRLITSVKPEELLAIEMEVSQSPWHPLNSLTQYWRIDLRARQEPISEMAKRFAGLYGVETAYAEQVVSDPVVDAADARIRRQGAGGVRTDGGPVRRVLPPRRERRPTPAGGRPPDQLEQHSSASRS